MGVEPNAGVLIAFAITQGGGSRSPERYTHPPTNSKNATVQPDPIPYTPPHPLMSHLGAKDMQGGCELAVPVYYKYTPKNFLRDWADAKNLSKGGGGGLTAWAVYPPTHQS